MMLEYLNLFIAIFVCLALTCVILGLSYVLVEQKEDPEKISAYECGFDPFDDARSTFDIRFYLVAILFIVFDLEITFLFPWTLVISKLNYLGIVSLYTFLIILTVGFIYEWRKGGLEWN
mgnify:CR=1 FL=1